MAGVLGRAFIQVFADLSKFTPGLRQEIKRALDEETKGLRFEELDKSARKAGEDAADEVAKGVDSKIDKNLKKEGEKGGFSLWKGLSGAFSAATVAFLPTLIALAVELVAALAPAVTALAATVPAAISGAVAAAATLKMAFSGIGGALKDAFDPKKAAQFQAALQKLAPAARSFVMEIKNLHPLFHQMQQDVQQVFFTQLQGGLTRVVNNLLPTLHRGLQQMAQDLGRAGRGLMDTLSGGAARNSLNGIFSSLHDAIKPLIPLLGQMAGAFLTIGAASGPLITQLSQGFAGILRYFAQFIDAAARSGTLTKFFADAGQMMHQLGQFLGVVFGLINDILGALQSTGAQGLGMLTMLIGKLEAFLSTAQGHEFLISLFNLLNTAISTLAIVLPPLIPPLAQIVTLLANGLAQALITLTPYLVAITNYLAQHPALLYAAIGAWAAYKIALLAVAVAEGIVDALNPVGLVVLAVAAIVAGAILIAKNWGLIEHWIKVAWDAVVGFFEGIWHWIVGVGKDIANWFGVTLPNFFASIPGRIWGALSAIPGLLWNLFLGALHMAGEAIGIGVGLIIAYFIKWPGILWDAVKMIGHLFVDLWNLAFAAGRAILVAQIDAVIWLFTVFPGKIENFVMRLPGILRNAFRTAWDWAKREVTEGANAVVDFVSRLPGRIGHFFDNVGHAILGGLKAGINAVIGGFNSGIDKVSGFIHIGLPHLPLLASGGLIKAPTLAVVGEAGPEAVIPMSDPGRAASAAQRTGLLDILGSRMGNMGNVMVRVYLGTREITDILDKRIEHALDDQAQALAFGTR